MLKITTSLQLCMMAVAVAPWPAALAEETGLEDMRDRFRQLSAVSDRQAQVIRRLEERLAELEARELERRGRGVPAAAQLSQAGPAEGAAAGAADGTAKEPGRSRTTEAIVQQEHALFDRKLTFEVGLNYTRYDRRQLVLSGFLALDAIFLGNVNLQQTKADLWSLDLTGRYGLTDRFSVDLHVPTVYRRNTYLESGSNSSSNELSEFKADRTGLGDVSLGGYYQILKETASQPDVVASLRLKAPTGEHPYGIKVIQPDVNNNNLKVPAELPTGNGIWTTSLGLSFLSTSDPAVLFANLGYNFNRKRHFRDISSVEGLVVPGEIKLGNSFQWGAGVALALNERTSMSLSISQLISQASRTRADGADWQKVVGSEASSAVFNVGLTHSLSDRLSLIGNVGMGLTPDAPDFTVGVKLPYTF